MAQQTYRTLVLFILAAICGSTPLRAEDLAALNRGLDAIVVEDSQTWVFNQYDAGSMHDAKIVSRESDDSIVVYGEYTFNGGTSGWVKVLLVKGEPQCLEFWDFKGICRELGHSPSQLIRDIFIAATAGDGEPEKCDSSCREAYDKCRILGGPACELMPH